MVDPTRSSLRKQSKLPLSLKVKYTLRARLERGEWPVGTRIPTLEELMQEYGVSRATVRAALDELENEGLIERTRG
ncbi:MAG: GntR family transcriptional regulator, partial [Alcaligenes sp.]